MVVSWKSGVTYLPTPATDAPATFKRMWYTRVRAAM
jgi:hypothetical protein